MSKKTIAGPLESEWPHKINIENIGNAGFHVQFQASPRQCKDVARRLRVLAVEDLEASATLTRRPGSHIIRVEGTVDATVTQACAISGEPLIAEIVESFDAWFSDEAHVVSLDRARRERDAMISEGEIPMSEEKDDPEPVIDGHIDVGELAVQYLSLAIDPYIRQEGVRHPLTDERAEKVAAESTFQNPFAALKDWKSRENGKKS